MAVDHIYCQVSTGGYPEHELLYITYKALWHAESQFNNEDGTTLKLLVWLVTKLWVVVPTPSKSERLLLFHFASCAQEITWCP